MLFFVGGDLMIWHSLIYQIEDEHAPSNTVENFFR